MNPQEQEEALANASIGNVMSQQNQANAQAQYYSQEQERTLADAQLECEKILQDVKHSLTQDIAIYKDDGSIEWKPKDEKDRVLTDLGVERILQAMRFYVNKENLLSNYDEKIINRRMYTFCRSLNSLMYMKYELYFRLPTVAEAKDVLLKRIDEGVEVKSFAMELRGLKPNKEQIRKELIDELEKNLEQEIAKVRKEKRMRNNMEYELLFWQVAHTVESVHQRAFRGEERGSLRRHTNISEVIGGSPSRGKDNGGGMLKWIKG